MLCIKALNSVFPEIEPDHAPMKLLIEARLEGSMFWVCLRTAIKFKRKNSIFINGKQVAKRGCPQEIKKMV
jgi:hypothetical protein